METNRKTRFSAFSTRHRLLLYCFITSLTMLAICSKSSFLYPFNDWVDANCYFTVGKGIMNGLVPYRDLVEQKGILLYFLHGIGTLVSHTTFIGVYFIEVIAGTAYLYYAVRTAALFVHERWGYVIAPVLAALVYSSASFAHGDSAEELCLPLLMFGLYWLLRFFKSKDDLTPRVLILSGVMAGCVLWIKYTMLGFWLGWMIAVFVGMLLMKQFRKAFAACLWFLVGTVAATVPWLIYFAANGALSDWFHVYFYLNFTVYAETWDLAEMLRSIWASVSENILNNPMLLVSIIAGLAGFVCTNKFIRGVWNKISFVMIPVLLVLGVYAGGKMWPYYFLILMGMLMLPGLIVAARALSALAGSLASAWAGLRPRLNIRVPRLLLGVIFALVLALSSAYAYSAYPYQYFMERDRETLAQYRFAAIMNEEKDPTLLNYGFLDGGFYTAADILPTTKYFCRLNFDLPEMFETQQAVIRNKAVRFVVLRVADRPQDFGSDVPYLLDNYELVETVPQEFEGNGFMYCLFRAK